MAPWRKKIFKDLADAIKGGAVCIAVVEVFCVLFYAEGIAIIYAPSSVSSAVAFRVGRGNVRGSAVIFLMLFSRCS